MLNIVNADSFLNALTDDLARIHEVSTDLATPTPTCPGWDVGRLIGHLGRVHRMALHVLTTGAMQPASPDQLAAPPKDDPEGLRAYFSESADQLQEVLRSIEPTFACWNFLNEPPQASFWIRRMAHEHAVHRVDAELAVGEPRPIRAELACNGIDEYFTIMNVRKLPQLPEFALSGSLHLHATDPTEERAGESGEWMITQTGSALQVTHEHGKGDAAIRGTASDLLLGLWGRNSLIADTRYERFGSDVVIAAAASLGGT